MIKIPALCRYLLGRYLLGLGALLFISPVYAETLQIPVGQQAADKWSIDRPIKGMNQEQVKALFGAPQETRQPRGEPPISSWVYPDYVVYFEYTHVIHTVLKK